PARDQLQRLQLPDRNDPQAVAAGDANRRGADHLYRARSRPFQDVRPYHPRSPAHGLAPLVPKQPPPPPRRTACAGASSPRPERGTTHPLGWPGPSTAERPVVGRNSARSADIPVRSTLRKTTRSGQLTSHSPSRTCSQAARVLVDELPR